MDISALKRDVSKVEGGDWVDSIPGMGEMRLRCRGLSSKVYTTKLNRLMRAAPSDQRDRAGAVLPAYQNYCMGMAAHETLLLEWDHLEDGGKDFPYDADVAKTWLTEPQYTQFLDAVLWAAAVVDRGNKPVVADIAKN